MNAAIRAVTRTAVYNGLEVTGIRQGYAGMINADFIPLQASSVSDIIQRGGTILKTARCEEFKTPEGRLKAYNNLRDAQIDGVVVIGGDGSFTGARLFNEEHDIPFVGIPGTIDNDIYGTDYTIGYDTAMNTAMEAIDKLRDTASSHERCSVIEVMGRKAGYIALNVGIATGAEVVLIPEQAYDFNKDVVKVILDGRNAGKHHYIVIVAEGAGTAMDIAKRIEKATGIEARATILGHLQRGGSPTVRDRSMASLMGVHAIECINKGRLNRLVIFKDGKITDIDVEEGLKITKTISEEELSRAKLLS